MWSPCCHHVIEPLHLLHDKQKTLTPQLFVSPIIESSLNKQYNYDDRFAVLYYRSMNRYIHVHVVISTQ